MFPEKPKREHPPKIRRTRRRWGWLLVSILVAMLLLPAAFRGVGRMGGEQWVDLMLLMTMFCCTIALLYQLGLRVLAQDRRPQEAEAYEYEWVDDVPWDERDL